MQYENRKSNAGTVLWGDIYELKALYELIHRIQDESGLLRLSEGPLLSLAYEVRHAFDRMRHKGTRKWYGEDATPIYGFDCIWPEILAYVGLMRAGMAFMPTITRQDQAVMYALESALFSALEKLFPGTAEQYLKAAVMIGQHGEENIKEKLFTRSCYFLTLTPAERKKHLGAIVDSLLVIRAMDNYLDPHVFDRFTTWSEYPNYRW